MELTGSVLMVQGFLLGVALSPTCLGVCLPLLAPYFGAEAREGRENLLAFLWFLAGRFLGYAAVGLIAGWLGQQVFLAAASVRWLQGGVFLATGLLLLAYALLASFPHWSWCRVLHSAHWEKQTPFLLGLLTGLNICPPFLAALAEAGLSGGPWAGFLILTSFFVGTSLILLPLPFIGWFSRSSAIRVIGRLAAGLAGTWFFIQGFRGLTG
ncbi:MAG: sulfite exporter TauE/SafE family protein [candidate division FCPU426 bacterium]